MIDAVVRFFVALFGLYVLERTAPWHPAMGGLAEWVRLFPPNSGRPYGWARFPRTAATLVFAALIGIAPMLPTLAFIALLMIVFAAWLLFVVRDAGRAIRARHPTELADVRMEQKAAAPKDDGLYAERRAQR